MSTTVFHSRCVRAAWLVAAAALAAGCAERPRVGAGVAYPIEKKQIETADIQVIRDETAITLTNTTARRFPACTVWLNAQFSLPTAALEVGETRTFDLSAFRNEFGERFRAGGFFATEAPDKLVQVQLELEDRLVGLITVREARR